MPYREQSACGTIIRQDRAYISACGVDAVQAEFMVEPDDGFCDKRHAGASIHAQWGSSNQRCEMDGEDVVGGRVGYDGIPISESAVVVVVGCTP